MAHLGGLVGVSAMQSTPIVLKANVKGMTGPTGSVFVPLFSIVGTLRITRLWGIVVTTIGPNHTDVYFDLWDGAIATAITKIAAAPSLNNFPVGSAIVKRGIVSVCAEARDATTSTIIDGVNDGMLVNTEFIATQKTGGVTTQVRYHYTSTDLAPAGSIQFYLEYQPYRLDGSVVIV